MKERKLTGIYFRIEQDGKYVNKDWLDMSIDERMKIITEKNDHNFTMNMLFKVSDSFREIADDLDIRIQV